MQNKFSISQELKPFVLLSEPIAKKGFDLMLTEQYKGNINVKIIQTQATKPPDPPSKVKEEKLVIRENITLDKLRPTIEGLRPGGQSRLMQQHGMGNNNNNIESTPPKHIEIKKTTINSIVSTNNQNNPAKNNINLFLSAGRSAKGLGPKGLLGGNPIIAPKEQTTADNRFSFAKVGSTLMREHSHQNTYKSLKKQPVVDSVRLINNGNSKIPPTSNKKIVNTGTISQMGRCSDLVNKNIKSSCRPYVIEIDIDNQKKNIPPTSHQKFGGHVSHPIALASQLYSRKLQANPNKSGNTNIMFSLQKGTNMHLFKGIIEDAMRGVEEREKCQVFGAFKGVEEEGDLESLAQINQRKMMKYSEQKKQTSGQFNTPIPHLHGGSNLNNPRVNPNGKESRVKGYHGAGGFYHKVPMKRYKSPIIPSSFEMPFEHVRGTQTQESPTGGPLIHSPNMFAEHCLKLERERTSPGVSELGDKNNITPDVFMGSPPPERPFEGGRGMGELLSQISPRNGEGVKISTRGSGEGGEKIRNPAYLHQFFEDLLHQTQVLYKKFNKGEEERNNRDRERIEGRERGGRDSNRDRDMRDIRDMRDMRDRDKNTEKNTKKNMKSNVYNERRKSNSRRQKRRSYGDGDWREEKRYWEVSPKREAQKRGRYTRDSSISNINNISRVSVSDQSYRGSRVELVRGHLQTISRADSLEPPPPEDLANISNEPHSLSNHHISNDTVPHSLKVTFPGEGGFCSIKGRKGVNPLSVIKIKGGSERLNVHRGSEHSIDTEGGHININSASLSQLLLLKEEEHRGLHGNQLPHCEGRQIVRRMQRLGDTNNTNNTNNANNLNNTNNTNNRTYGREKVKVSGFKWKAKDNPSTAQCEALGVTDNIGELEESNNSTEHIGDPSKHILANNQMKKDILRELLGSGSKGRYHQYQDINPNSEEWTPNSKKKVDILVDMVDVFIAKNGSVIIRPKKSLRGRESPPSKILGCGKSTTLYVEPLGGQAHRPPNVYNNQNTQENGSNGSPMVTVKQMNLNLKESKLRSAKLSPPVESSSNMRGSYKRSLIDHEALYSTFKGFEVPDFIDDSLAISYYKPNRNKKYYVNKQHGETPGNNSPITVNHIERGSVNAVGSGRTPLNTSMQSSTAQYSTSTSNSNQGFSTNTANTVSVNIAGLQLIPTQKGIGGTRKTGKLISTARNMQTSTSKTLGSIEHRTNSVDSPDKPRNSRQLSSGNPASLDKGEKEIIFDTPSKRAKNIEVPPVIVPQGPNFKIYQEDYHHLDDHIINKTFRNVNQFVSLTFKHKEGPLEISKIAYLSRILGLGLPRNQIKTETFKTGESASVLKEKLLRLILLVMNQENDTKIEEEKNGKRISGYMYKFYATKGNNGIMVRSILKSRWWWNLVEKKDVEHANLLWTQLTRRRYLDLIPPKKDQGNLNPEAAAVAAEEQGEGTKISRIYNHLEDNYHINNKKAIFLNLKKYYEAVGLDPFDALPLTFHIKQGVEDPEFLKFKEYYDKLQDIRKHQEGEKCKNVWIIKPGENTNRGNGISVEKSFGEIKSLIKYGASDRHTYIIQKYIEKPLLINKRKFDIRVFALMTSVNGYIKGYYYEDGYLRTSCKEFTLKNLNNRYIHLTNDAVQKKNDDYGKYESGNKISYTDFQKYLDANFAQCNVDVFRDIFPQIKKLVTDSIRCVYGKIDKKRRCNSFELFGYDFMIDSDFKVYLIEINSNPCLEISSTLLARMFAQMLDNVFRIAADPLFLPPQGAATLKKSTADILPENKFTLIFDERIDGPILNEVANKCQNVIIEIDESEEENSDSDPET